MAHKFLTKKWARLEDPRREEFLPRTRVFEKMGLVAGQVVVDIGCGTGFFARKAADIVGPEGTVFAVDIAPEMLAKCREFVEDEGKDNVVTVLGSEAATRLPAGVAHHVLTVAVFHEIADDKREAFLDEVRRLLGSGGRFIIVDWAKKQMDMGPPYSERVGLDELQRWVENKGWRVDVAEDLSEHYHILIAR